MKEDEVKIPYAIHKGEKIHISKALNLLQESGEELMFLCVKCNQRLNAQPFRKYSYLNKNINKVIKVKQRARFGHNYTSTGYCPLKDSRNKNNKKPK